MYVHPTLDQLSQLPDTVKEALKLLHKLESLHACKLNHTKIRYTAFPDYQWTINNTPYKSIYTLITENPNEAIRFAYPQFGPRIHDAKHIDRIIKSLTTI